MYISVLSSGVHGPKIHGGTSTNISLIESALDHCGANFCFIAGHSNDNLDRPPDSEIYEISAIYLACVGLAVAMMAFLVDPLSRYLYFNTSIDQYVDTVLVFLEI